ncbi:target of rapamycin complex 2 subunit MAPKAP1-like [Actinia tenebrosa]|uniref:Target of rapamycin complex 2 subunit MAPKAP1 n=1 Tax=Actinia tenebrosa TaxID=6105 RepID=A0A6P8IJE0_ACTTE|nr:target of rapamycin complex 2 subunit MAPKAP1-like [Actinia tenebrosa]
MAFLDDPDFLISHIRNSCVTSDDTGMCEMVIVNEEAENNKVKQRRKIVGFPHTPDTVSSVASSVAQSFDIAVSPDIQKPRSKTGGKTKKGRDQDIKIKNIAWKDRQESVSSDDIEDAFKKRPIKNKKLSGSSSQLSKQIKESNREPSNPYLDYARFDGEAYQGTCPTKKLRIFLTMLSEDEAAIPIFVTVLGTAHVQDLIGLIMYKYTADDLGPALKGTTDQYCLRIAEDDGEVDMDFPALDKDELITKFGFTCLALVENEPKPVTKQAVAQTATSNSVILKVNDPRHGFSHVKLDSRRAKMKVVYDKMLKKRGLRRTGHEYVLEKQSEPGVPIDLEAPLDSMGTTEFVLTRGGRKQSSNEKDSGEVKFDFTSFQYKSYRLQMLHKLRTVTEIQLGVSLEGIEIDPVSTPRTSKLWPVKQKPVSYDMENIADCEVTDWKNGGRTAFRIWYYSNNSHEFKHHDFEADNIIADEIVMKLKHIFKSTVSEKRRNFLSAKEKKGVRRKNNR